jgi:hypothetical protein
VVHLVTRAGFECRQQIRRERGLQCMRAEGAETDAEEAGDAGT